MTRTTRPPPFDVASLWPELAGTWQRWMPIEESGTWDGPPDPRLRIQAPAGLELGMASVYVFVCRDCPDWPIETVYQR